MLETDDDIVRVEQSRRNTKELFFSAVKESVGIGVLSVKTARKCCRRARQYICAYYAIEVLKVHEQRIISETGEEGIRTEDVTHGDAAKQAITLPLIEKLQKEFKTHRSAIDFDRKFIGELR
jgi:hypothetical protein